LRPHTDGIKGEDRVLYHSPSARALERSQQSHRFFYQFLVTQAGETGQHQPARYALPRMSEDHVVPVECSG